MKASTLRLRAITEKKTGRRIEVLTQSDHPHREVYEEIDQCLSNHGDDCAGYAFIVWDSHNVSTAAIIVSDDSKIPEIMVPEFLKARADAYVLQKWSRENG